MDIRNYFSTKPGVKPAATGTTKPSGNAASGQAEKKGQKGCLNKSILNA